MMDICYVFGSADIKDYSYISVPRGSTVISADGGFKHIKRLGLKADWAIGDFDSSGGIQEADNTKRYKSEKDETDMYLAVEKGKSLGYRKFIVYGGLGGRIDHTIANIKLMYTALNEGVEITLIDYNNRMFMVKNKSITVKRGGYKYLSVFSAFGISKGVSLSGVKYPLEDYNLEWASPLGISNEITDSEAHITVKDGVLLIIEANDNHQ